MSPSTLRIGTPCLRSLRKANDAASSVCAPNRNQNMPVCTQRAAVMACGEDTDRMPSCKREPGWRREGRAERAMVMPVITIAVVVEAGGRGKLVILTAGEGRRLLMIAVSFDVGVREGKRGL